MITQTDLLGEYSLVPGIKGDEILISTHYKPDGQVFSAGTQFIIPESDKTLNFSLVKYDAVSNGQACNFVYWGEDWLIGDLVLNEYKSVWYG